MNNVSLEHLVTLESKSPSASKFQGDGEGGSKGTANSWERPPLDKDRQFKHQEEHFLEFIRTHQIC